jgi:hypothetical protein
MTHMYRLVCPVSAGLGGSGFMTFHATDFAACQGALSTFLTAIKNTWPSAVTVTLPATGPVIEDTTGRMEGTWAGGTSTPIQGLAAGKFSAASGYMVHWLTGSFLNGRQVRGKTFFVPIDAGSYDTNGTLDNTTRTNIQSAANTFVGAAGALCWHRPTTDGGTDGHGYPITSALVPDKVAILRSRRD